MDTSGQIAAARAVLERLCPICDPADLAILRDALDLCAGVTPHQLLRAIDPSGTSGPRETAPPVIVARLDREYRHLWISDSIEQASGLPVGAVVGRSNRELGMPDELSSRWEQAVDEAFRGLTPAPVEFEYPTPDGAVRYYRAFFSPQFDAGGRVECVVKFAFDMTPERVREAEVSRLTAELRDRVRQAEDAERTLHAVMEHVPEGITIVDGPDMRIRMVSRYGRELTGRPREAIEGLAVGAHSAQWGLYRADGVTPAPDDELPLTRATRHGEVVKDEELVLRRPDGRMVPLLCNAGPIRDALGGVCGGVLAWRDITERREGEVRLKAFLDSGVIGILFGDVDGRVYDCNEKLAETIGYSRREVLEGLVRWDAMTPPEDLRLDIRAIAEARAGGSCTPYEKRYVRKDGTVVPVLVGYTLLPPDRQKSVAFVLDLTALKEAEDAARVASEQLRAHVENSPLAVIEFDASLVIRRWTPAAERVFGWSAAEVVGRVLWDLPWVHPDDRDKVAAVSRAMLSGADARNISPNRNVRKDGRVIHCEWYNSALMGPDGRMASILSLVLDVTERVEAERAVEEGVRRQSAALLAGDVGTFEWDIRGDRLTGDRNFRAIFGFEADDAGHAPLETYVAAIHPDDRAEVNRRVLRTITDGVAYEAEYRVLTGGEEKWVVARGRVEADEAGRPWRFLGVVVDVSAQKRTEQALRQSEAKIRAMADAIPQLAWIAEANGEINWYNRRWYEYTGSTPEEMHGWGWVKVHDPVELPRMMERWKRHLETGLPWEDTFPLRRHDGTMRWHLSRAMPIHDEAGRVLRWFGTNTDIEDQRRARAEIERLAAIRDDLLVRERESRQAAEQASRAKDRFLAVLSHELRTPLTPVALAVSAMEVDPELPPRFRAEIGMIRRNVELETRLIDDLLDLNRAMTGKLRLDLQSLRLHAVLLEAIETVKSDMLERRIALSVACDAPADWVSGDAARLQQVFWNLLKNAAKFTPTGGRVTVRTRSGGAGRIVVEVRDTGCGIPAGALARVFEPFEQGTSDVTRRFGGLGLGLAIARSIVELHAGEISAASDGEGLGAAFSVSLPTVVPAASEYLPTCAGGNTMAARSLSVLLVEDHPDTGRTLERLLRLDGTRVHLAGSVAAALDVADREPVDVVVSDLGLPDGTGHDLIRALLARHGRVPAIALSGYGMEEDVRQSREAGFTEHLVKPIGLPQLREAIRRVAFTA